MSERPSVMMSFRAAALFVFIVAVAARCGLVVVRYADEHEGRLEYPDEVAYVTVASSLAAGGGLVDEFGYRATYMPGYPWFLSLFVSGATDARGLLCARLVQALLAALVAPGTMLLTRRFLARVDKSGSASRPLRIEEMCAGVIVAVDPFLVFFSGLLLTESLYAAVLVWAWAFVMPVQADGMKIARIGGVVTAGLLLSMCLLLRPASIVVVMGAMCAVLALCRWRAAGFLHAAIIAITVLCVLFPWALRNRNLLGEWVWLTTRGGVSLYDGVRVGATGASNLAHTKTMAEVEGLSELAWRDFWRQRARDTIRHEPGRIIALAGEKFVRTWSLTPNVAAYHGGVFALISFAWMSGVLLLAGVGLWRWRHVVWTCGVLLLPVLLTTLLHMLFVGSVRYRVPVMPMVMVLSAAGVAALIRALSTRRS